MCAIDTIVDPYIRSHVINPVDGSSNPTPNGKLPHRSQPKPANKETPLPLRLGAYSDRSTCRSHSITLKYVVSVLYLTNANVRLISQTMKTNSALRMRRVPAGNNLLCLEQHKRHV